MHNMKLILPVFIFTFGFATATHAQQVNTLLTKQLPEAPGKEIEVITVNYAPGAVDAIHRHDAQLIAFEAFKLANYYMFGKPVTIVTGVEEPPPIKIDISAIPHHHKPVGS